MVGSFLQMIKLTLLAITVNQENLLCKKKITVLTLLEMSQETESLKPKLVRTGLKILREKGIEALSLRAVARRLGVSEAAPYRHFESKEALIAEICREGFMGLNREMQKAAEDARGNLEKAMKESFYAYIRFALENSDHFRTMFGNYHPHDPTKFPDLHACAQGSFEGLVELVRACQAAGLVRSEPPFSLALQIWSTVHGLAMLVVENKFSNVGATEEQLPEVMESLYRLLWRGLK